MGWLTQKTLQQKIINDPYYRFQSFEEIAIAAALGIKINVNQANVDDWLRLPGISIHQARMLVQLISSGVELLSIEDLAAALSLSIQRLKPLEPILEFSYYHPDSFLTPVRLNPNTATIEQLLEIPLITPQFAEKIIIQRQEYGKYQNLVDFKQRLELDGQMMSQLMHYLQF
ncbi:DNA uptake protein [Aphanothece hegewaldii CCALA 016]|uniref:DNA uptake protein n=1 Tax=Aphanothece hegewaldii CCALA 016 TaxID=2107694 RepID=A0A2T1M3C3_9CHRO|nr:ComEA family DNA-binding protein [Aphanothece hegewaldii]PSF39341.1 DNA uptake protein [Aphanothece hegewaldii CCALA 016]